MQARAAQPVGDPIESFIASRTAPTAQWLRSHREWLSDKAKNEQLTQAHYHALGEGVRVDTPEYFAHVERQIGLAGSKNSSSQRTNLRVNPSDTSSHISGNRVALTRGESERATDGSIVWNENDLRSGRIRDRALIGRPIGHGEFARRKVAMHRQGFYDRLG
jgi:hypothetical protein